MESASTRLATTPVRGEAAHRAPRRLELLMDAGPVNLATYTAASVAARATVRRLGSAFENITNVVVGSFR